MQCKPTDLNFNSIKVRLKPLFRIITSLPISNFNSIKVRLKLPAQIVKPSTPKFQFHKGTIKTVALQDNLPSAIVFQFHKGTIKTLLLLCKKLRMHYFNSIKVRLKHNMKNNSAYLPKFQFHKGTIKTRLR